MRAVRRAGMTMGLVMVALLPVAAAVSAAPAVMTANSPAFTHSLGALHTAAAGTVIPTLPEASLLILVGGSLLALAALVRRTT